MELRKGDILIEKSRFTCKVKFVEYVDEAGVILVDGTKDESYKVEDYDKMWKKYEVLVRRENREDTHI